MNIYMQRYKKLNGFVKHLSFVSNKNKEYSSKSYINQPIQYTDTLIEARQNSVGAWENP